MKVISVCLLYMLFASGLSACEKNLKLIEGAWKSERYLGSNKKEPYSTFLISLTVNKNNKVHGSYCYVKKWGNQIDCFEDNVENLHGYIQNDGIVVVDFYSSWGGKNGKALIKIDVNCTIEWKLLKATEGISYVPKKAYLIKIKEDNKNR